MVFKGMKKRPPTKKAGYSPEDVARNKKQALNIVTGYVNQGYDVYVHNESGKGFEYPYTIYTKKRK